MAGFVEDVQSSTICNEGRHVVSSVAFGSAYVESQHE